MTSGETVLWTQHSAIARELSIPRRKIKSLFKQYDCVAQRIEQSLPKAKAMGSNPIAVTLPSWCSGITQPPSKRQSGSSNLSEGVARSTRASILMTMGEGQSSASPTFTEQKGVSCESQITRRTHQPPAHRGHHKRQQGRHDPRRG